MREEAGAGRGRAASRNRPTATAAEPRTMIELEYTLQIGDLAEFAELHLARSPSARRNLVLLRFGGAAMLLLIGAVIDRGPYHLIAVTCFLAAAVLWVILLPTFWRWLYRTQALETFRQRSNRTLLAKHTISIEQDGVLTRSEYEETKVKWEGIEKVEVGPQHVMIYVTAASAIVIPKRGICRGDYEAFVAELGRKVPFA